jgi:hypothetical protein
MTLNTELARFQKGGRQWRLTVTPWPSYNQKTLEAWWPVHLGAEDSGKNNPGRFGMLWNGERFACDKAFYRVSEVAPDALDKAKAVLADALPMQKLQPAPTCTN